MFVGLCLLDIFRSNHILLLIMASTIIIFISTRRWYKMLSKLYMTKLLSYCPLIFQIYYIKVLRNWKNLCKIWTYKLCSIALSILANRQIVFIILFYFLLYIYIYFKLYAMNLFIRGYFILFLVNVHFASYQLGLCFVHSLQEAHVLDAFMNRHMTQLI